jgi:hypothetical protein
MKKKGTRYPRKMKNEDAEYARKGPLVKAWPSKSFRVGGLSCGSVVSVAGRTTSVLFEVLIINVGMDKAKTPRAKKARARTVQGKPSLGSSD